MRDFTLDAYLEVIDLLRRKDYPFFGIADWMAANPARGALLRHDVDRKPANALEMAQAEADRGIRATYYFRILDMSFDPAIIRKIAELGHEIGYHYEDLSLAGGDHDKAMTMFTGHLARLRELAPITTIAMHGRPFSAYNSQALWDREALSDYGLIAEAFRTVDYSGTFYFTDTGRRWDAGRTNLRDRPKVALFPDEAVPDTPALKSWIERNEPDRISISAHPERWDAHAGNWYAQMSKDRLINLAKEILVRVRPPKPV
ncbi:hypothetical protein [Maricaulis sp.]|uniref:hypothetical protein n=1 Tax=Maricaulis sp. TaxID=1486257 RepID=UPI003A8F8F97